MERTLPSASANGGVGTANRYLDHTVFIAESLTTSVRTEHIPIARNTDCSLSRTVAKSAVERSDRFGALRIRGGHDKKFPADPSW